MKRELFGEIGGTQVFAYTIATNDISVRIGERGATVLSVKPFGREVAGGFDTLEEYLSDTSFQGAFVGRVANRVKRGEFSIDGVPYRLVINDYGNTCHSGPDGMNTKIFSLVEAGDDFVTLSYLSPDGEAGFPGDLAVTVIYRVKGCALIIDYTAVPKKHKTPIALTNHTYFNLNGLGGNVEDHKIQIFANRYTEVDENLIPTGNRPDVSGTQFDLRTPKRMGDSEYDHNFILNASAPVEKDGFTLPLAARVFANDLVMNVYTDTPGLQFYMGRFLAGKPDFRGGVARVKHGAFALEAQTEPNCITRGEGIYDEGQTYRQTTAYEFEKRS